MKGTTQTVSPYSSTVIQTYLDQAWVHRCPLVPLMQIYDLWKETHPDYWTVHTPLFYGKIVEIEDFALQVAILDECQIYLGGEGGGGVGRFREEEL